MRVDLRVHCTEERNILEDEVEWRGRKNREKEEREKRKREKRFRDDDDRRFKMFPSPFFWFSEKEVLSLPDLATEVTEAVFYV